MCCLFYFFKQKTAYEMRISDWSSDVCSSDLWIVPFPPGGAIDMVSRVLAQRVSQTLGQPVTVENRPGSGGIIGSAEVARSPADGYTLLVNSTVLAVDKWFYPNVAYDARKAFAPVALLATIPSVLVVPADSPYKDARSLQAYADRKSTRLNS